MTWKAGAIEERCSCGATFFSGRMMARVEASEWRAEHVCPNRGAEPDNYRARATRAEQEVAAWRYRFDTLLAKVDLKSAETPNYEEE